MKLKPNSLYEIHWLDIRHTVDWIEIGNLDKEIEEDAKSFVICSWTFLKETEEFYVFMSGKDEKNYYDIITMPKGVIKKIKLIK